MSLAANASVAARAAVMNGDVDTAITLMAEAAKWQLSWAYTEPPNWHYPLRQCLGALLLKAGRPAEAEAIYHSDLRQYLVNPWSLLGVAQAMKAQPHVYTPEDIVHAEAAFKKAWARADVPLSSSCPLFGIA